MVLLVLSTETEAVQDLAASWTWSLKFCKLLKKNRMLVADDLHYEWTFPVLQFGERCTNMRLHPYHLQRVQHLKPEDPPRRIAFCQWLLQVVMEQFYGQLVHRT
jgi:hypothetical protein